MGSDRNCKATTLSLSYRIPAVTLISQAWLTHFILPSTQTEPPYAVACEMDCKPQRSQMPADWAKTRYHHDMTHAINTCTSQEKSHSKMSLNNTESLSWIYTNLIVVWTIQNQRGRLH